MTYRERTTNSDNLFTEKLWVLIEFKNKLLHSLKTDEELKKDTQTKESFVKYIEEINKMISKKIIEIDVMKEMEEAIKDYNKNEFNLN